MIERTDATRIRTTSGSRARDHLANERTWLAWMRTGLSVVIFGLAIEEFAPDKGARSTAAGVLVFALGAAGLVYGAVRYRTVNRELEQGYYLTGSRGRSPVIASALLVITVSMALLLLL